MHTKIASATTIGVQTHFPTILINSRVSFANHSENCYDLNMKTLHSYSLSLLAKGKYFFSRSEAMTALGLSALQFQFQAWRLSQKKIIKSLGHHFFMIITPEYYNFGSLPPHWLIDPLMNHLQQEYYIGLLSAASLYGATNQQPMVFQIITNKPTRMIALQRGGIEFHVNKNCRQAIKTSIPTPTSAAAISTKEQTLNDLVRYFRVCGYLSNVAMAIKELAEECTSEALALVVQQEKIKTVLQRLGYILELVEYPELANAVEKELKKRNPEYILLQPDFPTKHGKKNKRWKLIINNPLELEA